MSLKVPKVTDVILEHNPNSDGSTANSQIELHGGRLKSVTIRILSTATTLRKGVCYAQMGITRAVNADVIMEAGGGYIYEGGESLSWDGDFPLNGAEFLSVNTRCHQAGVHLLVNARIEL